ncbi:hypothetical protein [Marinobacterium marinum]|uniref:Uncharacterized protein n=1 Tax=Marinobacterium marinum TaxID=2756129 RepID=A0A7W1WVH8_9GAMM|nr:hypothetical protein [Marinobacterium marinum]MBA4501001.1 hypothetical protein [Marinobacterium marinum]
MKKKILSLAVAAGLAGAVAGTAQAGMHINDKGLGEALIFPFYSAENGNMTNIHIVNTTNLTKAVKVRFIEGMNSEEVLDFNLYLSPEDHWSGSIYLDQTGAREGSENAVLVTTDNSCTVPMLGKARGLTSAQKTNYGVSDADVDGWTVPAVANYAESEAVVNGGGAIVRRQPFTNFQYVNNGDSTRMDRTREGYIEIIEMGTLDPDFGFGDDAEHNANGMPNDCGALVSAWATAPAGAWAQNALEEVSGNTGGLYGYASVINVEDGTSFGVDAVAIDSMTDGLTVLHAAPGTILPSLAQAEVTSTVFDGSVATDTTFSAGIDAVSSLFMVNTLSHDFVVDPSLNASTDWVITMPTKRFYVENGDNPFTATWSEASKACEPVSMTHWDREEAFIAAPNIDAGFSPMPDVDTTSPDANLCTEVSIIDFAGQNGLKSSDRITYGFTPDYETGWARLSFRGADLNDPTQVGADASNPYGNRTLSGVGLTFQGLPAVGFAVQKVTNDGVREGVVMNYGSASVLKSTTDNIAQ